MHPNEIDSAEFDVKRKVRAFTAAVALLVLWSYIEPTYNVLNATTK